MIIYDFDVAADEYIEGVIYMTQTKRKKRSTKAPEAKTDDLPEAISPEEEEEISVKSSPPAEERSYTVGSWRGFTQYQCKLCPWDTLEGEAAMLEHLRSAHAPAPEPKSPILIADKSGRQIN